MRRWGRFLNCCWPPQQSCLPCCLTRLPMPCRPRSLAARNLGRRPGWRLEPRAIQAPAAAAPWGSRCWQRGRRTAGTLRRASGSPPRVLRAHPPSAASRHFKGATDEHHSRVMPRITPASCGPITAECTPGAASVLLHFRTVLYCLPALPCRTAALALCNPAVTAQRCAPGEAQVIGLGDGCRQAGIGPLLGLALCQPCKQRRRIPLD
jgi:hypothetical protein